MNVEEANERMLVSIAKPYDQNVLQSIYDLIRSETSKGHGYTKMAFDVSKSIEIHWTGRRYLVLDHPLLKAYDQLFIDGYEVVYKLVYYGDSDYLILDINWEKNI